MGINILALFIAFAVICSVASFSIKPANFRQQVTTSKTQLFEVRLKIRYTWTDSSIIVALFFLIIMENTKMINNSFRQFLYLFSCICID